MDADSAQPTDPVAPIPTVDAWTRDHTLVLDGGLATELEALGHDLDHPLWSAHLIQTAPDAIRRVHRSYLDAGADCILAASYQASLVGLAECGFSKTESRRVLEQAVELAKAERDQHPGLSDPDPDPGTGPDTGPGPDSRAGSGPDLAPSLPVAPRHHRPWVAASIGPYGAYLADGSEFRGNYGLAPALLRGFHRDRLHILWDAGPDLLAIETLPDAQELRVLLELLDAVPGVRAWISFSCRDGKHLHDGTPVRECAALCRSVRGVVAVGVNCTAPVHVASLIRELRAGGRSLPIVVYPNSGEQFDPARRGWTGHSDPVGLAESAVQWRQLGASMIGGCCRTRPEHIRAIRRALNDR